MRIVTYPRKGLSPLANPYSSLLYRHMRACEADVEEISFRNILRGKCDVFHVQWPDYYLNRQFLTAVIGSPLFLLLVLWMRLKGTKVVWTAHNLQSHNRLHPFIESRFWHLFARMLNGYITLTSSSMDAALREFPELKRIPGFVIPHGHYRGVYPVTQTRDQARRILGLSVTAKVILFFGAIARYKNVPKLIEAFRQMQHQDETILLVAGNPGSGEDREAVVRASASDSRVHLALERIPNDSVQAYFLAADLVALPFTEITNSGSAILALSLDRPVLVPARGSLPELQHNVGLEWVRTYSGDISSDELSAALAWSLLPRPRTTPLEQLEWESIGEATYRAFETVLRQ